MTAPRYHPLARLFFCALGLIFASIVMSVMLYVGSALATVWTGRPPEDQLKEIVENYTIPLLLLSYPAQILWISYCRTHLDGFSFGSLGLRPQRAIPNFARGAVTGALAIALLWSILWLSGLISVTSWSAEVRESGASHAALSLAGYALAFLGVGFFEELLFRGYALHNFNNWLGWKSAVVVQGVLFAVVHLGNIASFPAEAQKVALGAMLSIFLIGVFFALSYRKTGSLWFPIGFHFAWNFCLGPVLSLPVSGINTFRLLDVGVNQSNWLTGGAFGAEGSFLLIPILIALIYFIALAPDHPQARLDLGLLNYEAGSMALPAVAHQATENEEEEGNHENRFRTKFGTSQGFSAETLRELRDLQEERERVQREALEAQKREQLATSSFAPTPVKSSPSPELAPVEVTAEEKPPEVSVPAPIPTLPPVQTPPAVTAPPVAPAPPPAAAPTTPSTDAPVKKKPASPRW